MFNGLLVLKCQALGRWALNLNGSVFDRWACSLICSAFGLIGSALGHWALGLKFLVHK